MKKLRWKISQLEMLLTAGLEPINKTHFTGTSVKVYWSSGNPAGTDGPGSVSVTMKVLLYAGGVRYLSLNRNIMEMTQHRTAFITYPSKLYVALLPDEGAVVRPKAVSIILEAEG